MIAAPRLSYPVRKLGRFRLGAEELIELGQTSPNILPAPEPTLSTDQRAVTISPPEAKLLTQVVDNLVQFSKDYPVEFQSYCPTDKWTTTLNEVGTWNDELKKDLASGITSIPVPAEFVFRLVDLEKCVSAARDARLSSSQWAFTLSAIGAILDWVLGITWLGVPMYVGGLALLYGRPLYAKYLATPQDPYAPTLAGKRACLSGECELIAMKLKEEAKKNPLKRQVLERVIIAPQGLQRFHWGTVKPNPGPTENAVCLAKDRFRVRVEGWAGDVITPTEEWKVVDGPTCKGDINIAVFPTVAPRATKYGPINQDSGHEGSFWVEYLGPFTYGAIRRAGPFGCTGDPVDHAMEDAGFSEPGVDGGYVIFDSNGMVVKEATDE